MCVIICKYCSTVACVVCIRLVVRRGVFITVVTVPKFRFGFSRFWQKNQFFFQ